jgi:hypothetical protein
MRKTIGAMLSVAIIAVSVLPSGASSTDRASARVFLAEATKYLRIVESHHLQAQAASNRFIVRLESTCPHALADDPKNGTRKQRTVREAFLQMALDDFILAGDSQTRVPSHVFANELKQLYWDRPAVTQTVADYRKSLVATFALSPPSFCAEAKKSMETGFAAVPTEATQFIAGFNAAGEVSRGKNLAQMATMMRVFLAQNEMNTVVRVRRLQSRTEVSLGIDEATLARLHQVVVGR